MHSRRRETDEDFHRTLEDSRSKKRNVRTDLRKYLHLNKQFQIYADVGIHLSAISNIFRLRVFERAFWVNCVFAIFVRAGDIN